MNSGLLHLRHPRRLGRTLCGRPLGAGCIAATVALPSAHSSIELAGDEDPRPTCRTCLVQLLSAALPFHGVGLHYCTAWPPLGTPRSLFQIGPCLRARREAAGLTRAQVARLTGLSELTIRNLESGRHPPTPRVLARLRSVPKRCRRRAR